ncbi:MAG: conjugal transfer protein TraF [Vicinamibacterales bacterium]
MSSNKFNVFLAVIALTILVPANSEAQALIGVRAQGLAGAFVGVADDASAVYWNPAGLATGAFVSFVLDYGEHDLGPEGGPASAGGAEHQTGGIVAISAPPVGIAYYRMTTFGAGPRETVVMGVPGREEVRRSVHALTTSTVGVALLQSVGQYLVVGGTLKLVRGGAAEGSSTAILAAEALDDAAGLVRERHTTGDVDLSAMSALGHLRLGVVARNLTTPSFALDAGGEAAVELARQVRLGGGWGSGWPGNSRVVVAVDADVTRRVAPGGERRDLAAGTETWWLGQRLGIRGGIRRSTLGEARVVVAAGVSGAIRPGMLVEGHVARGQHDERSWSVGLRFGF